MMRLDKYLAEMGVGTRQEVKKQIRQGKAAVNGTVVKAADTKIDETSDEVTISGQNISYVSYEYYMLNKPAGVVSATEDRRDTTVIDLIKEKKRKDLFPVGRLDKDTEGLLLITNDGDLAHRLLAPKKHVDKVYYAKIDGMVTEEDVKRFAEGIDIGAEEEEMTRPAKLDIMKSAEESEIRLTIHEGKFHQVKRMFLAVGKEVTYLKRERMGTLCLDENLKPGEYRLLTEEEIENVRK
ncbi:pseudouridine synthase [Dorea longicatena]|uniref:pseudouridine synthase n=1 Tax=Dorea longicatena TaxID=88431 RepID=UPI00156EE053|nr:pseudouridine synthase [Dorea longicatena]NSD66779.1 rRNA pseudouridine synthase [Dorea longicatena]